MILQLFAGVLQRAAGLCRRPSWQKTYSHKFKSLNGKWPSCRYRATLFWSIPDFVKRVCLHFLKIQARIEKLNAGVVQTVVFIVDYPGDYFMNRSNHCLKKAKRNRDDVLIRFYGSQKWCLPVSVFIRPTVKEKIYTQLLDFVANTFARSLNQSSALF